MSALDDVVELVRKHFGCNASPCQEPRGCPSWHITRAEKLAFAVRARVMASAKVCGACDGAGVIGEIRLCSRPCADCSQRGIVFGAEGRA